MPLDKEKLFATQRKVLENHADELDSNFMGEYSQRVPIAPERGEGFFDFHVFDNLLLGRADCTFKNDSTFINEARHFSYGIHIMLSGELPLQLLGTEQTITPKAPEIWLSKGEFGTTQARVTANQHVRNIVIEFTPEFIEPLGREADADSLCTQLIESESPRFIRLPTPSAETIQLAWKLYDYAGATSYLELMAIQGATFSLVSHLLNSSQVAKPPVSSASASSLKAQAMLDEQFAHNWSIRTLARAVGINECDLKREFKAITGSTINYYLRTQRMRAALTMLESGENNLAHIADAVGYRSKDYFVRVFRQYYGFHPKDIVK